MFKKVLLLIFTLSLFACSGSNDNDNAGIKNTQGDSAPPAGDMVERYIEGMHYTRLKTPLATNSDKIVVTEFFWYGCPHCEHFEPVLEAKKPADVELVRSPAVWSEPMKLHAKLFFFVQTLPDWKHVHARLFQEVISLHDQKNMGVQDRKLAQFLTTLGVSEDDYQAGMKSPELESKVKAAMTLMQKADVQGTPAIMIDGKYMVNNQAVKSVEELLDIADFLIAKERQSGGKN